MTLRELFVRLSLSVDERSFARGQLAANAISKAFTVAMDVAARAVGNLEDALIGFNARAEQQKMGLAGIAGMNLKLPWEEAKKAADELFKGLQEDAAKTPAETSELVDFAQQIAGAYLAAGKNMQDLRQFTTQAVVAAKMLRAEGTAATDIKQAIQGRVGVKDMFAQNVISTLGMSVEEFNKKSMQERADLFAKGLNNPTIRAAMEEYEGQWDGITSTLKDNVAIILGEIGQPLFKFLKQMLGQIATWVQKNREAITKTIVEPFRRLFAILSMLGHVLWQAGKGLVFWVEQMERNEKIINLVLLGLLALQAASVRAALAAGAAWAKALLPFTLLYLILDDIRVFMSGGDSLTGDFLNWLAELSKPQPGDSWIVTQLRSMLSIAQEVKDSIEEIRFAWDDMFGDGSLRRASLDKRASLSKGEMQAQTDRMTLQAARTLANKNLPLTPGMKAAMQRQGVTESSLRANVPQIAAPVVHAPEARVPAANSTSSVSHTGPLVQIGQVVQQPGESGEGFANRVAEIVNGKLHAVFSDAVAGVGR